MKSQKTDELNELLHWLAYNYPGIYRQWSNEKTEYLIEKGD